MAPCILVPLCKKCLPVTPSCVDELQERCAVVTTALSDTILLVGQQRPHNQTHGITRGQQTIASCLLSAISCSEATKVSVYCIHIYTTCNTVQEHIVGPSPLCEQLYRASTTAPASLAYCLRTPNLDAFNGECQALDTGEVLFLQPQCHTGWWQASSEQGLSNKLGPLNAQTNQVSVYSKGS